MRRGSFLSASELATIARLAEAGATCSEIARRLGRNPSTILHHLPPRGSAPDYFEKRGITLDIATWAGIDVAAEERNLTPAKLVRRLLTTICADKLIGAILDDDRAQSVGGTGIASVVSDRKVAAPG